MYLIQTVTGLPTSDILGFFADLGKILAEEGLHYMYEGSKTSSMRKEVFDFFPGSAIPFCMFITGDKDRYRNQTEPRDPNLRYGSYQISVGFPSKTASIDQTELANIIMEKAILGACDMPPFAKPDPRCSKMYKDIMKEVQSRRMV